MKPRRPSHPDHPPEQTVHNAKLPGCGKVWVNPKSYFKTFSQQAWSQAEVRSPKFIDISQLDMRTTKPDERPKAKAAAAGESRGSSKSPKG
jgi:hypothetical protein